MRTGQIVRAGIAVLAAGAVVLTGLPASAAAPSPVVDVIDRHFAPTATTVSVGIPVEFDFVVTNKAAHTTTDNTGLGLWDSGVQSPGATFLYADGAAGTFAYHCTIHAEMVATLFVKDTVKPRKGTPEASYTVTWAQGAVPAGIVFDVQMRQLDVTTWQPLATGTTATDSGPMTLTGGTGTYQFRSRTRNPVTGAASGWSPAAKVVVAI